MSLAQVLVLGCIQGLAEFLPISSTAHLILLPYFFNFPDPGLVFDISLHLGTLLAILIYFRKEWLELIRPVFPISQTGIIRIGRAVIIVATIPGILFGMLFEHWAESIFRTPLLIAFNLVIFGFILWFVDKKAKHLNELSRLTKKRAFFVGFWQALAIIPGVSRSGATITGGLLVGLTREAAVRFSFMLSAPIIFGSIMVGVYKIADGRGGAFSGLSMWLGILSSFNSGVLAINFLLKYVQTKSFLPFVLYRIALAFVIIWIALTRGQYL